MPTTYSITPPATTTVNEAGPGQSTPWTFTVSRDSTAGTGSIGYRLGRWADSPASANDFVGSTSGTLTFEPGVSSLSVTLQIAGDDEVENTEKFMVQLFNPSGGSFWTQQSTAYGTIVNDDGTSTLSITCSQPEISESTLGIPGQFTITLQRTSTTGYASIDYEIPFYDWGTISPGDFASPTRGTVVFAPGEATRQITLTLADDLINEADSSGFYLTWLNPVNLTPPTFAEGLTYLRVLDDDYTGPKPWLTITSPLSSITESNKASTPWSFTVARDITTGRSSVDYEMLFDGAPTNWTGPTRGTITFAPGEKSKTVTLNLTADTFIENPQQAQIRLTNPQNAFIRPFGEVSVNIIDDDLPTISIKAIDGQVGEDDTHRSPRTGGTSQFLITRSSPVGKSTVDYRIVPGTASAADINLSTLTGTLTFTEGVTELYFTVPIQLDSLVESAEAFSVQLSNPTNAILGTATAQETIIDDDGNDSVLMLMQYSSTGLFTEYLDEPTPFEFVLRRSRTTGSASVRWQIEHETTTAADFIGGITSGVVEFAAGEAYKTVKVNIAPDLLAESMERFRVRLTNPVGVKLGDTTSWTATIVDDARRQPEINITTRTSSRTEGPDGPRVFDFLVTRNTAVGYSTVAWSIEHGTTDRDDFYSTSGMLAFKNGETTKTLQILVAGDTLQETDETFRVVLSSLINATIGAQSSASATILNDDRNEIAITTEPNSVSRVEGTRTSNGTSPEFTSFGFVVTRSNGIGPASVDWTIEPGTTDAADFAGARQGTIEFANGQISQRLLIPVVSDSLVETDETFTVRLSNPTNAALASNTSAQATIVTDDLPSLSIRPTTSSVLAEGQSGTTAFNFTVTRDSGLGASSATWTVYPIKAQKDDLASPLTGTVSFANGETSKPLTVLVRGDTTVETEETFFISLSAPKNATIPWGQASANGVIVNDDSPVLSIKTDAASVSKAEGAAGSTTPFTFTVTRTSPVGTTSVFWQVTYEQGTGTDAWDFTGATSGRLFFNTGQTSQTLTVSVKGDALMEANEAFKIQLSYPEGTVGGTLSPTASSAQATILNDDWPVLSIDAPTGGALPEGQSGTTAFTFTVTRDLGVGTSSATWTVQPGTAQTADFGTPLTGTVSFASGETRKTISVPVKGDTTIETDETFSVVLSAPKGAVLGQASAQATIVNDDLPLISVRTDTASVSKPEGSTGTTAPFTFTATRSSGVGTSTVDWTVRHITGNTTADDFAGATSGTLTFAPGVTSLPVTVQVQGDAVVEGDESFDLALTNARNASFGGFSEVRTGATIRNDDLDPPTLAITRDNAVRNEGAPGTTTPFTFKVTRSHGSGTSSVDWAVNPFGADAADFSGATSGTLRFAAGQTEQLITVQVAGDSTIEADELFLVQLRNPVDATITTFSTEGTIVNDDLPLLSIAADTAEQDEGSSRDGPTEFRFTVTRQPAVNYTEVNYRVVHGTTNADDFLTSSTTGTVTFADGQSSKPVSIRVMADLVVEANERFSVELYSPTNGTLLTRTATMTILGDDAGPLEPTLYAA